jgi:hypothetical protein
MAGLVPAIHVLQNFRTAGGYVYIVAMNPDWDDLFDTIAK